MNQMSLLCDAPGCRNCTAAPVILGAATHQKDEPSPLASRWLHVKQTDVWHHFCPAHSAQFLARPTEPISDLLLVADKSTNSYSAVEEAAAFLDGLDDVKVTLLCLACGRYVTPRKLPHPKMLLEQAPQDDDCPGTRNAINKLSALLENRSIPFVLTVQVGNDTTDHPA